MIDSLSYEGSTGAAALHLVTGNVAVTEGTGAGADDGSTLSQSLRRIPNGRDTQNNSTDVAVGATTPGAPNL